MVAVLTDVIEIDIRATNRPESARARVVAVPVVLVGGTDKYGLPRVILGVFSVGRAVAIDFTGHDLLDFRDTGLGKRVHFGHFDQPFTLQRDEKVLVVDLFVRLAEKVFADDGKTRLRLAESLRAFEHHHVIDLAARSHGAGDQHFPEIQADRLRVGVIFRTEGIVKERRKPRHVIPQFDAAERFLQAVPAIVLRHVNDGAADGFDRHAMNRQIPLHVNHQPDVVAVVPFERGGGIGLNTLQERVEPHLPKQGRVALQHVQRVGCVGVRRAVAGTG